MGRKLRSSLPSTQRHLLPMTIQPKNVIQRRGERQASQQRYYNRGAHQLPSPKVGEHVGVQLTKGDNWKPATVVAAGNTPRSLVVQTEDGGQFRRNRRFLRQWPTRPSQPTPATKQPAASPAEQPAASPAVQPTDASQQPAAADSPAASAPPTTSDPPRRTSDRTSKPPNRLDL